MGLEFDYVFLSTLSLRRATTGRQSPALGVPYFYPRSPCGERRVGPWPCGPARIISIHALLAESDQEYIIRNVEALIFLSTLSLRRATSGISAILTNLDDFYPRSPCGERHRRPLQNGHYSHFYPRSPCGERLKLLFGSAHPGCISIHALLAESDTLPTNQHQACLHFYPRSPCGERHRLHLKKHCMQRISIHALLAESDNGGTYHEKSRIISIHALLAESDRTLEVTRNSDTDFYPRSPCGERRCALRQL